MKRGMNLPRLTASQDLVFFLEEFDIPSRFAVRDGRNRREQGVKNDGHVAIVVICSLGESYSLLVPRLVL